jgi:hypothetical protein
MLAHFQIRYLLNRFRKAMIGLTGAEKEDLTARAPKTPGLDEPSPR